MSKVIQSIAGVNASLASFVSFFIGLGVISASYKMAYSDAFPWLLYWLGFFLCAIPVLLVSVNTRSNVKTRCLMLFLYGLAFFLIQFLGSNGYFYFRDEYLMHNITKSIYASNHIELGQDLLMNPIYSIIIKFPGMELLIVAIQKITGIGNAYPVAATVISVAHSMVLVFVFLITRLISSDKVAGISSFVYASNIDYSWFNTIYHYESIGLLLFFIIIYLFLNRLIPRAHGNNISMTVLLLLGLLAITITHHLSSYVLLITTLIIGALYVTINKPEITKVAYLMTLFFSVILSWLVYSASDAVTYFQSNILKAIKQIVEFSFLGSVETNIASIPTWGKGLPGWELLIHKYLYTPSLVILFLVGAYTLYRNTKVGDSQKSIKIALCLIGMVSFGAVTFSATGLSKTAEITRRLIPFFYLGTAFIVAYAIVDSRDKIKKAVILSLLALIVIGGTGIGTTRVRGVDSGGPKYYYADAATNPDTVQAGRWIKSVSTETTTLDGVTSGITGIQSTPLDLSNNILVNDKVRNSNWEPIRLRAFGRSEPGTPEANLAIDELVQAGERSIKCYDNGSQKIYTR